MPAPTRRRAAKRRADGLEGCPRRHDGRPARALAWVATVDLSVLGFVVGMILIGCEPHANNELSASQWWVDSQPDLVIGHAASSPEYELFRARRAVQLGDRRIVVVNEGVEVRYYHANGSFQRVSGRQGRGPGEYMTITALFRLAEDSLVVIDQDLARVSVLDRDGKLVRLFPLDTRGRASVANVFGRLVDGRLLAWTAKSIGRPVATGIARDSLAIVLFDRDGVLHDSLGHIPGGELYVRAEGGRWSVSVPPISRTGLFAAAGDRLFLANGERFDIGVYSNKPSRVVQETAAGYPASRGPFHLISVIERETQPVAVAASDRRALEERYVGAATGDERARLLRMFRELPLPEAFPPIKALRLDTDGFLWVEESRSPVDSPPRWWVFDTAYRAAARVETPSSLAITEIGRDYVLGIHRDSLGVESVRRHRLTRVR